MLPTKVPTARIWAFNYESEWLGPSPKQTLGAAGNLLVDFLLNELGGKSEKPIIFIAHSFDGLIVAQAIASIDPNTPCATILELFAGAVFLGSMFLLHTSIDSEEAIDAGHELLELFEYLPLALVQAAAYMAENNISLIKYLGYLKTKTGPSKLLGKDFPAHGRDGEATNAITAL